MSLALALITKHLWNVNTELLFAIGIDVMQAELSNNNSSLYFIGGSRGGGGISGTCPPPPPPFGLNLGVVP